MGDWFNENANSNLPIKNPVYQNVWFTINGLSKTLFFNFCLFHFSEFQITIDKTFLKKTAFFVPDFKSPYEVLLRHKYFHLYFFDKETRALLNFFKSCT